MFLLTTLSSKGQFFQATIDKDGNDLIFLLRVNPGGGDITTNWSDTEFFVRWPDNSPAFNFGTITVNTTDFPGINIPNNGQNAQGSETGYTNNWFGSSYSATSSSTYIAGLEYEIFRVTLDIPAANVNFELVHNEWFAPHYLALIDGSGGDLSNVAGNMFYGDNAMICNPNCPASTPGTNHVVEGLSGPLPVELFSFTAEKLEKEVQLDWITALEENNRGFSVERKTAQENWKQIGFIDGKGTTVEYTSYSFLDTNPASGNNYYRLKQIDFDGTFEYSETRVVHFEANGKELSVYPNPSAGQINFNEPISGRIIISNALGQIVWQQENMEAVQYLDLSNLSSGSYVLENLARSKRLNTVRFVISRN